MMPLTTRSIIVVDGEKGLATLYKAFLTNEGYDIIAFVDPLLARVL